MTHWHDVATVKDLEARKKQAVVVDGTTVALFYIKGKVYALHDTCIHEQRQLSKGAVLFGRIICPGHQWKFDPETGEADGQDRCQPTYPVRVSDEGIVSVSLEPAVVAT
jgi:nitrite reductase (NADH) small subunit